MNFRSSSICETVAAPMSGRIAGRITGESFCFSLRASLHGMLSRLRLRHLRPFVRTYSDPNRHTPNGYHSINSDLDTFQPAQPEVIHILRHTPHAQYLVMRTHLSGGFGCHFCDSINCSFRARGAVLLDSIRLLGWPADRQIPAGRRTLNA